MSSNLIVRVVALAGVLVMANPCVGTAKPERGPVSIEFSVPPGVKTGDEVTTVLKFRALEDIRRLDVEAVPFAGVVLLSTVNDAVFTDVKKGEAPQLEVKVRLTASEWGALSVAYTAQFGTTSAAAAVAVIYGYDGPGK